MKRREGKARHLGRLRVAVWLVLVGISLAATGAVYILYSARWHDLPGLRKQADATLVDKYEALLSTLSITCFLFVSFLLGSYIMVQFGRWLMGQPQPEGPTEYVDAWSSYRLSDDEVDAVVSEMDEDLPPDATPPSDEDADPLS